MNRERAGRIWDCLSSPEDVRDRVEKTLELNKMPPLHYTQRNVLYGVIQMVRIEQASRIDRMLEETEHGIHQSPSD